MTVDAALVRKMGASEKRPRGATRALYVDEGLRALRHPVTIVAVVLQVVLWLYNYFGTSGSGRFPVMTDADHATQVPMMLLMGSAAFLTGNFAVIRSARFRTDLHFNVMPLSARQRALAMVLSTTMVSVLSLAMTGAHLALLQSSEFAAGSMDIYEVLTGPVVVLTLGLAGVLLGHYLTSAAVAPLVLLAITAIMAVAAFPMGLGASRYRWLLPLAVDDVTAFPMPGNLLDRPARMHLIYIAGLCLTLGAFVLWRFTNRRKLVGVATTGLIVATAVAGHAQLSGPSDTLVDARAAATVRPAAQQICQTSGDITYCAFRQFRPWIADWRRVSESVLAAVPGNHPKLYVRQRVFIAGRAAGGVGIVPAAPVADWRLDDERFGTPDALPIGTTWGTGAGELELAASVAARVVTGDTTSTGTKAICGGPAIAILWIAGHADSRALREMRNRAKNGSGDLVLMPAGFSDGLAFNRDDLGVALSLLGQPSRDIRELASHWDVLTNPNASSADTAKLLGVSYPGGSRSEQWC